MAGRRVYACSRQETEWVLEKIRGQSETDLSCLSRALASEEIYVGVLG